MSKEMPLGRAAEILDPAHRESYESMEPVNEACRMGRDALLLKIPRILRPVWTGYQVGGRR